MRTRPLPLPETGLAEIREKYRALFESDMMGITVSDLDERILEANDAFLALIGYTRDDLLLGRVTWSAITPSSYATLDRRKVRELYRRSAITPFEKRYIRKDRSEVPVLVGAALMRLERPLAVSFALDITERKRLEIKKDEFIGTVSHELQTPLAVLRMQLGLLRDEVKSGARAAVVERAIGEIEEQAGRLSLLVGDLLNLARYVPPPGEARRETCDLAAVAKKVVEDARLVSGRRILFNPGKGSLVAAGHDRRIAQVVTNLLMNALRYSPESKPVTVSLAVEQGRARVAVRDQGVGIPPDKLEQIFERFYRVEHAGDYARGASGIGLYVAREIARAAGGSIGVRSAPGKGSTFTLVLPLASRPA
ncbi:MAG: HAMP domain-containing histidine kinase [Patescibacteria group bacterium]|nr:HAMP domain-containing histidine kinase [Patescibacteria group bacterium]MDE1944308.1 HAMP domain-containing histidine kinase [Patescibacteria group bacterium]MDE1945299.1 HAMP domain-containing histidine kinase [Patescibacteria group bacterium]MDE2057876.1 HAMP domain-containing histidine kinase [Patescibacteria group bacterium]